MQCTVHTNTIQNNWWRNWMFIFWKWKSRPSDRYCKLNTQMLTVMLWNAMPVSIRIDTYMHWRPRIWLSLKAKNVTKRHNCITTSDAHIQNAKNALILCINFYHYHYYDCVGTGNSKCILYIRKIRNLVNISSVSSFLHMFFFSRHSALFFELLCGRFGFSSICHVHELYHSMHNFLNK